MPAKFKEEWVVRVGRRDIFINEKQVAILKEAMRRDERWVNFGDVIISIPHVECIYLERREPDEGSLLPLPSANMSDDDIKAWKKLREKRGL